MALKSDVEVGGTDQKFNLLTGRTIQKRYGVEQQVIITLPLLVGTGGKDKMSKSLGNYIGINESPNEIYGKVLSISDDLIYPYFLLTTEVPQSELADLRKKLDDPGQNPKEIKMRLAREIVTIYYSPEAAGEAEAEFNRVFGKKEIPTEVNEFNVGNSETMWIVKLLTETSLCNSNGDARRMLKQGAVQIDGERVKDPEQEIELKNGMILKVGKRKFIKIVKSK